MKNPKNYFPLLLNFSLLALLTGQAVSDFGNRLNYMALIDLIARYRPGSAFELSKLLLFIVLPALIFTPLVGVYVDRWNRKKIMIASNLFRSLLVLLIPLGMTFFYSLNLTYAIIFLFYSADLFFNPARGAIIPDLVPKERLLATNSLFYLVGAMAAIAGTALGGILVGLTGWENGFYANAVICLLSAAAISFIIWEPGLKKEQSENNKSSAKCSGNVHGDRIFFGELKHLYRETIEGLQLVRDNPLVLFAIASASIIFVIGGIMFTAGLAFLKQVIQATTVDVGIFAALVGIGVMIGIALLNKFGRSYSRKNLIFISFFILGMLLIGFSNIGSRINLSILMLVSGVIITPLIVVPDTLLQEIIPYDIRGRIFSLKEFCIRVALIITTMSLGLVADLWNKKFLLMGAGGTLSIISLLAAWLFWNLPATAVEIRTIDRDSAE